MWGRWLLTEHPGRGQRPPGNELQAPGTRGSVPAGPSERPGQGSRWVGGRDSALVPSPCGPGQGAADEASGWVGPESAALLGHGQDRAGARRAAPREGPWCLQQHQRPWRPRRTRTRGGAGGHTQIHTHTHTHPHTHKDGHTHSVPGDFWGSQEGCQGPSRPSGRNRGVYARESQMISTRQVLLPFSASSGNF